MSEIYNENYFNGKDSFFYALGYGKLSKFFFNNLFKPLVPHVKKIKKGRVLDVGCAYGFMLQKFPDSFKKYGLDISEHAIEEARKRLSGATLKVSDIENKPPFPEHFFDIIIFNDVIEHLENPKKALENIFRMLKKDGVLYLNTPNLNWLRKKMFAHADKKEHHISLLPHKDLFNLLEDIGFKVKDRWTYTTLTVFFNLKFSSNIGHESAFICEKV